MGTITMIPARRRIGSRVVQDEIPKIRVAAYCRVSTDTDEQATSYEAQVEHYTEYIMKNPAWECAGIYADDGISGTNTKKREEFNRLIDDCMKGRVDMVITKSISRFARNTLDCLNYIRKLKDKNIAVYFEKEGINTLDAKGEVMLTIMASLAQQESESLSQNVRLGLQYRYQQGKVLVNHTRFLGYDKDEEGNLIINKEEAEVIKRIYREYDSSIFTAEKNIDFAKAIEAKKNVQDYVIPDSDKERDLTKEMELDNKVVVYAKLPRGFQIPTPVGNYSPDWAIAFEKGTVKHIFFVAETKGTMETLSLKPIEQAKIKCARKLFSSLSSKDVVYHDVDTYQNLMAVMESI